MSQSHVGLRTVNDISGKHETIKMQNRNPFCKRCSALVVTDVIKDDQEPFNSIGLIPPKSFYGSEIKLNGELEKTHGHCLTSCAARILLAN